MQIQQNHFGTLADGQRVTRFTLINDHGNRVDLIDRGATIVAVEVPDRDGNRTNINLGFQTLDGYLQRHPYFGSTVGRFCNRIGGARFEIEGRVYELDKNHGEHQLHGGSIGFDALMWDAQPIQTPQHVGVRMSLTSPDGDQGFPGTLSTMVEFTWNNDNELAYEFTATSDAPTHVNLTNHAYWNLGTAGTTSVREHLMEIHADQSLDVDDDLIPTGRLLDVAGSPLDFRTATALGDRIDQLIATKGYDHCYVVRGESGTMRIAATAYDPTSGRSMQVWTTQPGVQLYTGNHLSGGDDAGGKGQHSGFCLETQHYPDAANQPAFQSTLLQPGETMNERTMHRFGIRS